MPAPPRHDGNRAAPDDPEAHNRLGCELHGQGQFEAAERTYRDALRRHPGHTEVWSNLGLAVQAQRRFAEAEHCQQQALRLAPAYPEAHNNLGLAQYEQGRVAEAENSFRGALRLRPDYANALMNLGTALQSLNRLVEAEASYRQALTCGGDPARVLNNLGLLLQELGRPAEAEAACRAALAHRPGQADARTNLALVLLLRGAYAEGWREYEARWQVASMTTATRPFAQPRWTAGVPLAGRTILLHAEQGFGDTLQFCRYASLLAAAGARVLLEAPPALCRLLASLDGVAQVIPAGETLPPFDLHCPLMSLPFGFGTTLETIPNASPYLHADPAQAASWRQALAALPGRRIGLVWGGSSRSGQPHAVAVDRRRSMPLAALAPLAGIAGCSFVSLQLGPPAAQPPPAGLVLHDPTTGLGDFADTAALIEALDLVISVDTAVAHLAAALGRPVWLLNRFDTCWRWLLGRDDSRWYPTLRQFRQPTAGDWTTPVARIAQDLARFAAGNETVACPSA
ncbi:MAG: tetratricopeptide repeat-containing glycosyltransferase family protein [Acetobacteraceae bacterium]|nr:tetratricopeptide repeat-containing glycosyltransferase family protein [Acetobacteraceae bacterium]